MRTLGLAAVATALLVGASPAVAKDRPAAPSPLVGALDACRRIADGPQRLACFDKASAALVSATQAGDVTVVDRAQMRQARRSLFGFAMPKLPFFAGDQSAKDDTGELDSTIVWSRSSGYGRYRIKIADGDAVWETTESYMTFESPRAGQKIHIKRGPLGSYFLQVNGQRGVKGRRVE